MAQIDIRREYADGTILLEADLDAIVDDVETFLNVTKLNNDNLQDNSITASDKIADASITAAKLGTSCVTTAKINDAAVTTVKIADSNVTTAKIADSNVTTAKIADSNVTTAKIADSNVTTAKIADSNVTAAKIGTSAVTVAKILATDWNNTGFSGASTASATVASQACTLNNVSKYEVHVFGRTVSPGASCTVTLTVAGTPVASNTVDVPVGQTIPWSLYYCSTAAGASVTFAVTQSGGGTTAATVFVKDTL